MITLFAFSPGLTEPSVSPFCSKVIYLLKMANADWQRENILNPRSMPHGKVPVAQIDGQMIADSHLIQAALEARGADFYGGLSPAARATGQAVMRMIEDMPLKALVHDRWATEHAWPICREAFFADVLGPVRHLVGAMVRRQVVRGLAAEGLTRMTEAERMAIVSHELHALSDLRGDQPFVLGETVTAADAACLAVLGAISHLPVETPLRARVRGDAALMDYIARVREAIMPA